MIYWSNSDSKKKFRFFQPQKTFYLNQNLPNFCLIKWNYRYINQFSTWIRLKSNWNPIEIPAIEILLILTLKLWDCFDGNHFQNRYLDWLLASYMASSPPYRLWKRQWCLEEFCHYAELSCPHMRTPVFNATDYAGLPAFRCRSKNFFHFSAIFSF